MENPSPGGENGNRIVVKDRGGGRMGYDFLRRGSNETRKGGKNY